MLRKDRVMDRNAHDRKQDREEATAVAEAELYAELQRALERSPAVQPPLDFAQRVTSVAASQPLRRTALAGGFAQQAAFAMGVLVMVVLFLLAPRAQASFANLTFDLELVVLAQLALLAWWLSRRAGGES